MCGITGALGFVDDALGVVVARMNAAQTHRGPDDEGCWRSPAGQGGAVFGFRRLAIIDLSVDGHQPMIDAATGNVIAFNGEIYNYKLIRDELAAAGVSFQSKSDTEVLLKAYGKWGLDAIAKLRGMFAFAIWDAVARRTVLARDRVGIKPLYLFSGQHAGRPALFFASELRSLLAGGRVEPRLNPVSLSTYLWNGFVVGPETIIQGVRLMPAGTAAIIHADDGRSELHRYWRLPDASPRKDGVERLRHELQTAAQQHLVSDVPLGVFLSGGIDSSAVASLAAQTASGRVRTFNISFDEGEFDESRHAASVAKALGTEHQEVRLTQELFQSRLQEALAGIDQPTFDAINTYFVSRAVREAGITVALAGTGGDELFGGYKSFIDIPKAARTARRLRRMPEPLLRAFASMVARLKTGRPGAIPPQTRWGKLGDVLATRGRLIDLYQTSYSLFTSDFHRRLHAAAVSEEVRCGLPRLRAHELEQLAGSAPDLHAISNLELSCFIGERLLRDTDAASMAVSLEARVPLLDHQVIEAAAAVDPRDRYDPLGRKQLLRTLAMPQLDAAMFDRPKSGFVLPIDVWCRERLRGELDAAFNDRSLCESVGLNQRAVLDLWTAFQAGAPGIYWSRVWSIFTLLWWCRRHRVTM